MPSIHWRDSIGSALITTPAYTFANWTPDAEDIGDRATGLGTGAEFLFGFRVDYTVHLEMTHIPPLALGDLMRLKRHLLSGGLITVFTDDAASRVYTCTLKPGSTPSWTLADRVNLEYTLTLELRHVAPVPMIADYSAVMGPTANLIVNGNGETGAVGSQAPNWTKNQGDNLTPTDVTTRRNGRALTIHNNATQLSDSYNGTKALVAGTRYLFSAWMRQSAISLGSDRGVWLYLWSSPATPCTTIASNGPTYFWTPSGMPSVGVAAANAATGWVHRWVLFDATVAGTVRAYVAMGAQANADGWWSDVRLEPVPAA